jgi:hypothetical protein
MKWNNKNRAETTESKKKFVFDPTSRLHAGDHCDFKISRHISPVSKLMFGWNTFVVKMNNGGACG